MGVRLFSYSILQDSQMLSLVASWQNLMTLGKLTANHCCLIAVYSKSKIPSGHWIVMVRFVSSKSSSSSSLKGTSTSLFWY